MSCSVSFKDDLCAFLFHLLVIYLLLEVIWTTKHNCISAGSVLTQFTTWLACHHSSVASMLSYSIPQGASGTRRQRLRPSPSLPFEIGGASAAWPLAEATSATQACILPHWSYAGWGVPQCDPQLAAHRGERHQQGKRHAWVTTTRRDTEA
jgi:hypothetical protein